MNTVTTIKKVYLLTASTEKRNLFEKYMFKTTNYL